MLSSKSATSVYIGVTNSIERRYFEHMFLDETTYVGKYKTTCLVHVEEYSGINDALQREKQLKKWSRAKKEDLITENNPKRLNLFTNS